jgi:hypothetical protein
MPTYLGRENMFADRSYSPGFFSPTDQRASLIYFAAAVPTVGFVHGAADLSPVNAAAFDGYAENRFIKRSTMSPQSSSLWPVALRWLA